jgi:glucans biosynthesis protein
MRVQRHGSSAVGLEVDFDGGRLTQLLTDAVVDCDIEAQRGRVGNVRCRKVADGRWRITFDVRPFGKEPVELRARLAKDGEAITETWSYLCRS